MEGVSEDNVASDRIQERNPQTCPKCYGEGENELSAIGATGSRSDQERSNKGRSKYVPSRAYSTRIP